MSTDKEALGIYFNGSLNNFQQYVTYKVNEFNFYSSFNTRTKKI